MTDNKTTFAFVGIAAVLAVTAVLANRPGFRDAPEFDELGTKFFPKLLLPEQATSLEVAEFDPETGTALPFKVALVDKTWVIPSHSNYPADARERLGRTAAGVFDLTRDTVRSDRPEDHKAMGVLDPLDPKITSPDGLGRRLTLRDASDAILADLIIGKEVPDQPGQRFVRIPGQNRVYGVQVENLEVSTRFADWIEQNLLKLTPASIRTVVFDGHKVDPERGTFDPGELLTVKRKPGAAGTNPSPWWMPDIPSDQELNTQALDTLSFTLADLRIVGVRRKPAGLTAELRSSNAESGPVIDRQAQLSLAQKGFYLFEGKLVSNEGNVYVTCDDGVVYILHFGAVTFARGESLSAGTDETPETPSEAAQTNAGSAVESRYLFVTTSFDPTVIEKPVEPVPGELPDDPFAKTAAERLAVTQQAEAELKRKKDSYEKALADGAKRAKELSDRFAEWYYVVPGDAFRKIVLDRSVLLRPRGSSAAESNPDTLGSGLPADPHFGLPGFPAAGR